MMTLGSSCTITVSRAAANRKEEAIAFREHPLERRTRLLSQRLKQTVVSTSDDINPPGQRPPLHNQISPRAALQWWMLHRYDKLGQQWLEQVQATPVQIAQLDAWLYHASQAVTPQAQAGNGMQLPAGDLPNPNGIISHAMGIERREEGPPIGDQVA